jgi:hypothetical protein
VTKEIPKSISKLIARGNKKDTDQPFYEKGFANRLMRYNTLLYGIIERSKTRGYLPGEVAYRDFMMVVPSFLYPRKKNLNPALETKMHFFGTPYAISRNPNDIPSAVFGFSFALFGYTGILIVWILLTIVAIFIRILMALFSDLSHVLSAIIFPSIIPIGNGIHTILSGARNITLFVTIVAIIMVISKETSKK